VWEDTNEDCCEFFRTYLEQYPEVKLQSSVVIYRIMVLLVSWIIVVGCLLQKCDSLIQTETNGTNDGRSEYQDRIKGSMVRS
jgi:hypothetical protein